MCASDRAGPIKTNRSGKPEVHFLKVGAIVFSIGLFFFLCCSFGVEILVVREKEKNW
jgi:hypothetical protein